MKKHLLKVFLLSAAVATSGMMFTSCKDYDDDIDNLNKKIDDLSGQIALKADQSAVTALQQKLEGIDFSKYVTQDALKSELSKYVTQDELATKLAGYVTSSGLDAEVAKLGFQKADQVNALIDQKLSTIKHWTKEEIEGIFAAQMEIYDIWGEVSGKVATLIQEKLEGIDTSISQDDINAVISAIIGQINAENSEVRNAILSLLGAELTTKLDGYVTEDMLAGYVKDDNTTFVKYTDLDTEVNNRLTTANKTLVDTIKSLIAQEVTDNDTAAGVTEANIVWLKENDLATAFKTYDTQISKLWSAIGDLADRIQSMVFVPTTDDGKAYFNGHKLGEISLTKGEGRKATMTFRISPATLAQSIVDGYNDESITLKFLPEKVATRAEAPAFTIDGSSLKATTDGKISMLVSTDYTYETKGETYSIALQVINRKAVTRPGMNETEEETVYETGTEFTTAYIATVGGDKADIFDKIVLASKEGTTEDDKDVYKECKMPIEYSLEYNNTTGAHKLLDADKYYFVFEEAEDEFITLEAAAKKYNWDYIPSQEPVIERTDFKDNGVTGLSLVPATPMDAKGERVTIGIETADEANIGKKVEESGKLFVSVKTEDGEQTVKKSSAATTSEKEYKATVEITRKQLGTIDDLEEVIIPWRYLYDVSGVNYGYSENQEISGAIRFDTGSTLSADQFKALDWDNAEWKVENVEGELAAGLTVTAVGEGDPYTGTQDSKHLRFKIEGYKNGDGTIAVSSNVNVSTTAMVTIKGTIKFEGMEDMPYTIDMNEAEYTVSANGENLNVTVADDIYAAAFEANKAVYEKYFTTVENFKKFMASATNNFGEKDLMAKDNGYSEDPQQKYAGLRMSTTTSDMLYVFFKNAVIDFQKQSSYEYDVPDGVYMSVEDAGFKLNFSGRVSITGNGNTLIKGTDLFPADAAAGHENPYLKAYGSVNGNAFNVNNINLKNAYKAQNQEAVVTYTLLDAPADYIGNYPKFAVDDASVLEWNDCGLDKVTICVDLKVNGVLMDSKTFDVCLVNPIEYKEGNPSQNTANSRNVVSVERNDSPSINLLNGLTLTDIYGNQVINPGTFNTSTKEWTTNGSLSENLKTAYGFAIDFDYDHVSYKVKVDGDYVAAPETDFSRLKVEKGELTVTSSDAVLAQEIQVTVPIKMTYKYCIEHDVENKEWVKTVKTTNVVFIVKNAD